LQSGTDDGINLCGIIISEGARKYLVYSISSITLNEKEIYIQGDQKVSVYLMITVQKHANIF
jgi:hypothetical protein